MGRKSPEMVDREFFSALIGADVESLRVILSDDFVLIDVMTGSEVPRSALLELVVGGHLVFEGVERSEVRVREYGTAAVVTGRTEMHGAYAGQPFVVSSRYTHVFIDDGSEWRMVAAQGTQVGSKPEEG